MAAWRQAGVNLHYLLKFALHPPLAPNRSLADGIFAVLFAVLFSGHTLLDSVERLKFPPTLSSTVLAVCMGLAPTIELCDNITRPSHTLYFECNNVSYSHMILLHDFVNKRRASQTPDIYSDALIKPVIQGKIFRNLFTFHLHASAPYNLTRKFGMFRLASAYAGIRFITLCASRF